MFQLDRELHPFWRPDLPPDLEDLREPGALRGGAEPRSGCQGLRVVLQSPSLSQGPGRRDASRCAGGTAGDDLSAQEVGAEGDF